MNMSSRGGGGGGRPVSRIPRRVPASSPLSPRKKTENVAQQPVKKPEATKPVAAAVAAAKRKDVGDVEQTSSSARLKKFKSSDNLLERRGAVGAAGGAARQVQRRKRSMAEGRDAVQGTKVLKKKSASMTDLEQGEEVKEGEETTAKAKPSLKKEEKLEMNEPDKSVVVKEASDAKKTDAPKARTTAGKAKQGKMKEASKTVEKLDGPQIEAEMKVTKEDKDVDHSTSITKSPKADEETARSEIADITEDPSPNDETKTNENTGTATKTKESAKTPLQKESLPSVRKEVLSTTLPKRKVRLDQKKPVRKRLQSRTIVKKTLKKTAAKREEKSDDTQLDDQPGLSEERDADVISPGETAKTIETGQRDTDEGQTFPEAVAKTAATANLDDSKQAPAKIDEDLSMVVEKDEGDAEEESAAFPTDTKIENPETVILSEKVKAASTSKSPLSREEEEEDLSSKSQRRDRSIESIKAALANVKGISQTSKFSLIENLLNALQDDEDEELPSTEPLEDDEMPQSIEPLSESKISAERPTEDLADLEKDAALADQDEDDGSSKDEKTLEQGTEDDALLEEEMDTQELEIEERGGIISEEEEEVEEEDDENEEEAVVEDEEEGNIEEAEEEGDFADVDGEEAESIAVTFESNTTEYEPKIEEVKGKEEDQEEEWEEEKDSANDEEDQEEEQEEEEDEDEEGDLDLDDKEEIGIGKTSKNRITDIEEGKEENGEESEEEEEAEESEEEEETGEEYEEEDEEEEEVQVEDQEEGMEEEEEETEESSKGDIQNVENKEREDLHDLKRSNPNVQTGKDDNDSNHEDHENADMMDEDLKEEEVESKEEKTPKEPSQKAVPEQTANEGKEMNICGLVFDNATVEELQEFNKSCLEDADLLAEEMQHEGDSQIKDNFEELEYDAVEEEGGEKDVEGKEVDGPEEEEEKAEEEQGEKEKDDEEPHGETNLVLGPVSVEEGDDGPDSDRVEQERVENDGAISFDEEFHGNTDKGDCIAAGLPSEGVTDEADDHLDGDDDSVVKISPLPSPISEMSEGITFGGIEEDETDADLILDEKSPNNKSDANLILDEKSPNNESHKALGNNAPEAFDALKLSEAEDPRVSLEPAAIEKKEAASEESLSQHVSVGSVPPQESSPEDQHATLNKILELIQTMAVTAFERGGPAGAAAAATVAPHPQGLLASALDRYTSCPELNGRRPSAVASRMPQQPQADAVVAVADAPKSSEMEDALKTIAEMKAEMGKMMEMLKEGSKGREAMAEDKEEEVEQCALVEEILIAPKTVHLEEEEEETSGVSEDPLLPVREQRKVFELEAVRAIFEQQQQQDQHSGGSSRSKVSGCDSTQEFQVSSDDDTQNDANAAAAAVAAAAVTAAIGLPVVAEEEVGEEATHEEDAPAQEEEKGDEAKPTTSIILPTSHVEDEDCAQEKDLTKPNADDGTATVGNETDKDGVLPTETKIESVQDNKAEGENLLQEANNVLIENEQTRFPAETPQKILENIEEVKAKPDASEVAPTAEDNDAEEAREELAQVESSSGQTLQTGETIPQDEPLIQPEKEGESEIVAQSTVSRGESPIRFEFVGCFGEAGGDGAGGGQAGVFGPAERPVLSVRERIESFETISHLSAANVAAAANKVSTDSKAIQTDELGISVAEGAVDLVEEPDSSDQQELNGDEASDKVSKANEANDASSEEDDNNQAMRHDGSANAQSNENSPTPIEDSTSGQLQSPTTDVVSVDENVQPPHENTVVDASPDFSEETKVDQMEETGNGSHDDKEVETKLGEGTSVDGLVEDQPLDFNPGNFVETDGQPEITVTQAEGAADSSTETPPPPAPSSSSSKRLKFSVSMDDLSASDVLTISFSDDCVNIRSSSRVLARSAIDVAASPDGAGATLSFRHIDSGTDDDDEELRRSTTSASSSRSSVVGAAVIAEREGDSGNDQDEGCDRDEETDLTEELETDIKAEDSSALFDDSRSIDTVVDVASRDDSDDVVELPEEKAPEEDEKNDKDSKLEEQLADASSESLMVVSSSDCHEEIALDSYLTHIDSKRSSCVDESEKTRSSTSDSNSSSSSSSSITSSDEEEKDVGLPGKSPSSETLRSILVDFDDVTGWDDLGGGSAADDGSSSAGGGSLERRLITAGAGRTRSEKRRGRRRRKEDDGGGDGGDGKSDFDRDGGGSGGKNVKNLRFAAQASPANMYGDLSGVPTTTKLCKLLFIGSSSAGKTSLIRRYVKNTFVPAYRATIGADFLAKVVRWDDHVTLRLQLWDIAGQDRFSLLSRSFYKDSAGAFIVSDLTRPETLDAVARWKEELDNKVQCSDGSQLPCYLLANKCDLVEPSLSGLQSKAHNKICQQYGFDGWIHTSAKEDINVEEAVNMLLTQICEREEMSSLKGGGGDGPFDADSIILDKDVGDGDEDGDAKGGGKKSRGCMC